MPARLTRSEFSRRYQLEHWRILAHTIEAVFVAPGYAAAAAFAVAVAAAADDADHHPDIDIRYPGRVRVMLTTHAARGLTDLDGRMARTIDELAKRAGLAPEPLRVARTEVAIDAIDFAAVQPFWKAVMAYVDEAPREPGARVDALIDPLRIGPPLWFQQMDAPRPQRNRIHVDVLVAHDAAAARIDAAIAAGGKLLTAAHAPAFWVLADPEGNEACICTWQGRD